MGDLLSNSARASYLYLAKYGYTGDVHENNNFLRIFPYADDYQVPEVVQFLTIPGGRTVKFFDAYENQVRQSIVESPHQQLVIAAAGSARIFPRAVEPQDVPLGVALTAPALLPEFLNPSPLVDPAAAYALTQEVIDCLDTLLQVVRAIVWWVHDNIEYVRGVTGVGTTATDVLETRQGVCQDLAHLTLAMMRSTHIPCRYVSGLLTGEVGETHAWVEFWHPVEGWVAADPTRNWPVVTGPDHLKFAAGRDYTDVPPVIGEFRGMGTGGLTKVVAEARLEEETPSLEEAVAALVES